MDAVVGYHRWRQVSALGLAVVVVAVVMTAASLWDGVEIARGLSGADRVRVVLLSLQSEAALVAIIGLLLVRLTELGSLRAPGRSGTVALTIGRIFGGVFLLGGIASATDAITRDSGVTPYSPVRGPAALAELSIAALGVVVWYLGSWPARPRRAKVAPTPIKVTLDE